MDALLENQLSFEFNSQIRLGARLSSFSQEEIKNEPMMFSADVDFCYDNAGPITRNFLYNLLESNEDLLPENIIVDSRVHMLFRGMFPAIPGYHHDDVPRTREDGQPNYYNPAYKANHCMALYNGDICPTEFALGTATFPDVPLNETYYKIWHHDVEQYIKEGKLRNYSAESNRLIYFHNHTWHQAVQAKANGWRLFIRASWNTQRKILNEVRRQVQVYMPHPFQGW